MIGATESFNIGILGWLAGLNEFRIGRMPLGPVGYGVGNKFEAIVHSQFIRISAPGHHPIQYGFCQFRRKTTSISTARTSRLKSSTTLNVLKRRPQNELSLIKSIDQYGLIVSGTASSIGQRLGSRFLPRRSLFKFSRQSIRWIRL